MAKIVEVDGRRIEVPDDATTEEIDRLSGGSPAPPQKGFLSSALDSSGVTGLLHAARHPVDTLAALPAGIRKGYEDTVSDVKKGVQDYRQTGFSEQTRRDFGRAVPILGTALATAQGQHDAGNDAGMLGTLAGTVGSFVAPTAAGKVLKIARPAAAAALASTGEAASEAGTGLLNKTAGMLKADFKRGANGGAAYFDAGGGPAISMRSLADKGAALYAKTGKQIGSAIDSATAKGVRIPSGVVGETLAKPIAKGVALETGPGGMGNLASLERYSESFRPALDAADEAGGFTPRQAFDLKRGIAENTNWADPSQFNLKAVRQSQVGALGGVLADAVPELSDLNPRYAGLKNFAARTASRAETGSSPLTTLAGKSVYSTLGAITGGAMHGGEGAGIGALTGLALDSVPVKTTLASGLYYGGKHLAALGERLSPAAADVSYIPPLASGAAQLSTPVVPLLTDGSRSFRLPAAVPASLKRAPYYLAAKNKDNEEQ